jgi:hypothetical protein
VEVGSYLICRNPYGLLSGRQKKVAHTGTADISYYCDDLEKTVAALKRKGIKLKGKFEDHRLVTYFKASGSLL